MSTWAGFGAGIVVILGTAFSVVATLIVPRGTRPQLGRILTTVVRALFTRPVMLLRTYETRDRLLALEAPLFLVLQLVAWLVLLLLGFALVLLPWVDGFGAAVRLAGSSMFTLGFASTPGDGVAVTAIVFCCAAAGLVVMALQISYLPTLYSAFNRRETLVTMLESRGGEPVWGPEILARHVLVDIVDNLPVLYAEWERWAADVAESHANYPVLMWMRSPNPLRSWVIGLLAVLDAAALQNALNPLTAPSECRLVLRMGFTAMRELAGVLRLPCNPDPSPTDPLSITEAEFRRAVEHMLAAGWDCERTVDEAYRHFRGWRVNYEAAAHAIADLIDAPPALWSGTRRHRPVPGTAPRRPADRRPDVERRQLIETAARRRAIRSAAGGSTLPAPVRAARRRRLDEEAAGAAPEGNADAAREAALVMRDEQF